MMCRSLSGTRVIVYGVGTMGAIATRVLVDKGAEIVGAIGRAPLRPVATLVMLRALHQHTIQLNLETMCTSKQTSLFIRKLAIREPFGSLLKGFAQPNVFCVIGHARMPEGTDLSDRRR